MGWDGGGNQCSSYGYQKVTIVGGGNSSNARIQAFALPAREMGFPSPAFNFCVLSVLGGGSGVGAVLQLL